MLKNMRQFDMNAEHIFMELQDLMASAKPKDDADMDTKMSYVRDVLHLLARKRECHLDAQRCAVDAAPYIHARMGSIEPPPAKDDKIEAKGEDEMTKDELRDYYNKLRIRPLSMEPLNVVSPTIDNDTGEIINNDEYGEADNE